MHHISAINISTIHIHNRHMFTYTVNKMCLYRLCNQPWPTKKKQEICVHIYKMVLYIYTVSCILFRYIKHHLTNKLLGKSLLTIISSSINKFLIFSYTKVSTVKSFLTNVVSHHALSHFLLQYVFSTATESLSWFPVATQQNGDQCLMHLCAKIRFMYLSIMMIIVSIYYCHGNMSP